MARGSVRDEIAKSDGDDQPDPRKVMQARVEEARGWFARVAPAHIDADQFVALAVGYIRRDPLLAQAAMMNPGSLMVALSECARLGLVVGDTYHLTHFNNRKTGVPDIVGMVDYRGEIQLIFQSGEVGSVHAHVVRANDEFNWQPNAMDLPFHRIANDGLATDEERGPLRGVYAYVRMLRGGYSAPTVLSRSTVAKHRAKAKQFDFWGPDWPEEGPWTERMWLKTAIHIHYDTVPKSAEFQAALLRAAAAVESSPLPAGLSSPAQLGAATDRDYPAALGNGTPVAAAVEPPPPAREPEPPARRRGRGDAGKAAQDARPASANVVRRIAEALGEAEIVPEQQLRVVRALAGRWDIPDSGDQTEPGAITRAEADTVLGALREAIDAAGDDTTARTLIAGLVDTAEKSASGDTPDGGSDHDG